MNSRREEAVHRFTRAIIFQPPSSLGLVLKAVAGRERIARERGMQMEPGKVFGRGTFAHKTHVPGRELDEPIRPAGLGRTSGSGVLVNWMTQRPSAWLAITMSPPSSGKPRRGRQSAWPS